MKTLGIETSCDETAAAVVENGRILSNVVTSSVDLHREYGGVVPEIASRHHVEYINFVIRDALQKARCKIQDIDSIAVTHTPGLVGSLLIGISVAKSMSYSRDIPIIGVNHVHAHLHACKLVHDGLKYPFVGLVVSGGHTSLFNVGDADKYKLLGQTTDDAAGEAYDKVAKILNLGYPGGPILDNLAKMGDPKFVKFPRTYLDGDSLDFSFSGIKTAVLYYVNSLKKNHRTLTKKLISDLAASFQDAVTDVLVAKALRACAICEIKSLALGGGVSANSELRKKMTLTAARCGIKVFLPPINLCVDNAAMVAGLGQELLSRGIKSNLYLTAAP